MSEIPFSPDSENFIDEFIKACWEECVKKQNKLSEEVGFYPEYFFDQTTSSLQFKENGKTQIAFRFIFIGSLDLGSETWLWGWNNQSLLENVRAESLAIKNLEKQLDINLEAIKTCDEALAEDLVVLAVHQLNALGFYKIPQDDKRFYLAVIEKMHYV